MVGFRSWLTVAVGAASLTATLALAPAARAALGPDQAKALAALETEVSNLGYTTTDATDKSHFWIDRTSKYDYRIDFQVSNDASMIYLYSYMDTWSPDQLAKTPFVKMLEFQNNGNVYFSMQNTSKGEDVYVNEAFSGPTVAPAALRSQLDYFIKQIDSTDTLWNTKLWK